MDNPGLYDIVYIMGLIWITTVMTIDESTMPPEG
jgi:hypothetical protein